MREIAYAKINLGLKVLGERADGYHTVDMIMQTVSLCDWLDFSAAPGLEVSTNMPGLPCDASNLVYKAAIAMSQALDKKPEVKIHLTKRIFLAAGLAGGSADAAAVLRGLNNFWQAHLTLHELEKIGATLGSDVPFCLAGGTARATGRGEILEELPAVPELWLVLIKPKSLNVATACVYKNFSPAKVTREVDIAALVAALRSKNRESLLQNLGNDLESVTLPYYPLLTTIKQAMLLAGAEATLMSGSGPTIFAIAASQEKAKQLAKAAEKFDNIDVVVAHTIQRGKI